MPNGETMANAVQTTHLIDHPSEHYVRDLATAVEGALWNHDPIRQSHTMLNIESADGVVTMAGNIRGHMLRSIAEHIARGVPGVVRVINQLVSDNQIESDASIAVAMDPEVDVTTDRIAIKSYLGMVHLSGFVADEVLATAEAKVARITELIQAVPGVREVASHLHAVEGSGDDGYVVEAVEDEVAEQVVGARAMGTLLSEAKRDKARAMLKAREATRAAAAG